MAYTVQLPDGRSVEFPDTVSKDEAARIIRAQLGVSVGGAPERRTGFGAALATGFENLIGSTTTAAQATFGDENKAAELALERAANSPYASQVSWDKVKEAYGSRGAVAAVGEILRQVPLAITEQLPQLAATLGGAKAGALAGTAAAPLLGPAAPAGPVIGGTLGALATIFPSLYGSNIERQAAEQRARGEAVDVDLGPAAGAAVFQTGLEAAATFIPLGRRVARSVFGPQVDALLGQGKKEAAEALAASLAKGAVVGAATNVPTEVLQAVAERYQAGLPLLDDDALKEYGQNAYGGALVGTPLGAAGRAFDRAGARTEARVAEETAAAAQRRAAAQAEKAQRESPEYIESSYSEYRKLLDEKEALEAQRKKGTKEAPLSQEDKDGNAVIDRQLETLKKPLADARQEFISAGGPQALKKARESRLELTPPEGRVSEPAREEEPEEEKAARSRTEAPRLVALLEEQRRQLAEAASPEEAAALAARVAATRKAAEEATGAAGEMPPEIKTLRAAVKRLEKQYETALQTKDEDAVRKVVPELLQVRQQLQALSPDTGLFAPEAIAAEEQRQAELLDEISAGREAARTEREAAVAAEAQARQRVEREREALERIRAGEEPLREAIGEAREARRLERTYGTLRQDQQFEMFPERRQRIERTEEPAAPELPPPREGARAQVVGRAAPEVVALRRQLAEQYRELRRLTRTQREAGAAPTGAEGPYSPLGPSPETAQRIEGARQRIEDLQQQLQARMQPAVTTTTVGLPAEGPQISVRPRGPLDERIRAMAQRIQAAPQLDDETKALVAEVADDLPAYVRYEAALAEPSVPRQAAEERASRRVAEWMYRTLSGRGNPQGNAQVRETLRGIADARPSEQEAGVQLEFPEMPEPRATAFGSYKEFYDYLTTRAPILVSKDGEAALSVVRMQAELEPLKAQIEGFKAKETALNTEIAALEGTMGAERAAAQRRVELARADLAAARNELESVFESMLSKRDLAQQQYTQALDASTEAARALGDHTRELLAAVEAQKTDVVPASGGEAIKSAAELVPGTQYRITFVGDTDFKKLGAADNTVGAVFTATAAGTGSGTVTARPAAVVFKGDAARRAALRAAKEKVETALDEWVKAETYKRDVVQKNIGKDWSETSTTFAEYSLAKRQLDAARKKLQSAKDSFNKASAQIKVFSPLSDADLQNYLDKEAALYDAFDARMRRLWGYSGRLKRLAKETDLEKFLQQREAAHQAFLKALDRPGSDLTAAIKGYRASIDAAATRTKDELRLYSGTQEQFDAFDRAQQNYAAAQEALAQVADNTRGTREQVGKLQKAAQELRTGAAALKKELRTKQSLIEARKTRPVQQPAEQALRAERERKSAEAAQAEQASLERLEALPREVITIERAKELIASDHPEYVRLAEAVYNTALSLEERAAAAKAADEFLQARQAKLLADEKKRLSTANTHINNIAAAEKTVDTLRKKLADIKLTVRDKKEFKDDPAGAEAALEVRREKARKALADAKQKLAGHRRKLAAALGTPKIWRTDPAEVRKARAAFFSGVVKKQGSRGVEPGERLGPRAIGPVTRPEVFAPREMRTGSEESRAGETTTQPDGRLKEALGMRQRDVPMTRKEQAEANVIAAESAVASAKTPAEKRLAEAQLAVAEARYEIVTKGDSNTRAQQLAEAEAELAALTLSKVKLSEKTPLTAKEEAAIAKELEGTPETKGKRTAEQNVDSFLKSLEKITKPSKKEKGLRAFGDVDVDVKKSVFPSPGKGAYISLIRNNGIGGKGEASAVLRKLLALADKYGVTLTLQPQKVGGKGLSTKQLEAWYTKSGFKPWDGGMYRHPKVKDKAGEETEYEAPEIEILGGPREEAFFSRGATAASSTTDSVRTELRKAFPDLGRVQIYDSVDALVKANPQYEGRIPADARGFVDTAGNKAFLIAENIDQGRALGVLLHEVGAHIGLKNMLGDAQYNALVKAVETWAKKTDGSTETKVAQAALARVEAAQTPASQRRDETLAYAIEEAVNAGVKPMETKSVLGQWLSRVAQLFRRALEKFGLPPKALDAQGLVDMAFGAAKMEMRPATPQMSRRTFLRGASAAVGAMKLPPLSKEMNLQALRSVFDASLDARSAWFGALKASVKNKGLGDVLDEYADLYEGDNPLVNFTRSKALQSFLYNANYDENYEGDGYDYYLNEMLSGKDGVKVVADLQQALRAQGASLVDAAQKTAKEKGLPEVGELFFSAPETGRVIDITKQLKERTEALEEKRDQLEDEADFREYEEIKAELRQLAKDAYERDILALWPKIQAAKKLLENTKYKGSLEAEALEKAINDFQTDYIDRYNKLQDVTQERFDYRTLESLMQESLPQELAFFDSVFARLSGMQKKAKSAAPKEVLFSRKTTYTPGLADAGRVAEQLVGGQRSFLDRVKANLFGFRTQIVDMRAPLEKIAFANMDELKATQLMFNIRMYDQRNHFVSESLATGVPERKEITRADGQKEFVIEAKPGANVKQMMERLSTDAVVKEAGSPDAANQLFTLYTAAKRAERVGFQKLGFGRAAAEAELVQLNKELGSETLDPADRKRIMQRKDYLEKNAAKMPSEADIKAAVKQIEANKVLREAFEDVREMYNEYNRNLLEFAVQTGAIPDALAKSLLAAKDYIPYYRVRGGNAELVIGGEQPMRIGNIKDSPQLEELVGGEEPIFDFLTSSVQNTSMLLDMSLRNMAVKNAMWELRDVGLAKLYPARNEKGGRRSVPENAVRFRVKGEDWFAIVDTDAAGVPSDLLVKGLAGMPTMLPAGVKMLAIPARILRRAIVANPVYMARQLFRESFGAVLSSGANMVPILSSLKQIRKENALDRRGITGGQVFTGMPEDMARMLREMQTGRPGWAKAWSALERASMEIDAATRRAQFNSYREQGLSEMEASYLALESMNFSKRGLSPTVHLLNTLIPFFNAQIQGLDVLYRSLRGQMPFNKRLDIRNKLLQRGALLFISSMAYAAAMQDEEEYKNARPDEKYGNWFVRMPFLDEYAEEPVVVRVPIPFELGYIFKALPEAIVNTMASEEGGKEALKALKQIAINTIPGGSSMPQIGGFPVPVPLPAGVKPAIELAMGRSFFTGRDIESRQEQEREPGERFRDNTSEAAKAIGQTFGISPIQLEYAIRGYTGGMGMALMQSLNFLMPEGEGAQAASRRMADLPLVGTLFQPMDAGGIIDATYERMKEIQRVQRTYENMLETGRRADAERYAAEKADELSAASVAGQFRQVMGEITTFERNVRASPTLSPAEKREKLDLARQRKIEIAQRARALFDRRTLPASPA